MASLFSILPKPTASTSARSRWESDSDTDADNNKEAASSRRRREKKEKKKEAGPPAYGKRQGFVPRSISDYADGGAFPEIHMVQFPLDMGRRDGAGSGGAAPTLSLQTDETGRIRYDLVLHQNGSENKKVHSTLTAMKAKDIIEGDSSFDRPDTDTIQNTTEKTKAAVERLVQGRLLTGKEKEMQGADTNGPKFVRYTPADQPAGSANTRIVKVVEAPVDPMEPPKFKHKKVPRGPASPPPPVMHSPPRKITAEEQRNWVIPPCISNWKNNKGYTIPLDKRLANDGRGIQDVAINDNFAKLAEALYIADRHAREEVRLRADMQAKIAAKEKREKEQKLQMLAQKAREERAGLVSGTGEAPSMDRLAAAVASSADEGGAGDAVDDTSRVRGVRNQRMRAEDLDDDQATTNIDKDLAKEFGLDPEDDDGDEELTEEQRREARERDRIRRDRARQRERELRMSHMGADTKARVLSQSGDRDISEKIALGLAQPTMSKETMYDQRLFNQSAGLSSGFGAEDSYGVYDAPLFQGTSSHVIYRPKNTEIRDDSVPGVHTEKLEKLLSGQTGAPAPHRGFQGATDTTGLNSVREGPVAFEKEVDVFGFQDFMSTAKRGRTGADESASTDQKRSRH